MTITATRPASQKQLDFITTLLNERDTCGTPYAMHSVAPAHLTSRQASDAITVLMTLPRAFKSTTPAQELQAGVYEADGHLYRVYLGQQSGAMLVKSVELDEGVEYRYLGKADRCLPKDARRLSLEEVGDLGKAWDHCLICGRRLDDPESVDRGIGPVCAKRYDAVAVVEVPEPVRCGGGGECGTYDKCNNHRAEDARNAGTHNASIRARFRAYND